MLVYQRVCSARMWKGSWKKNRVRMEGKGPRGDAWLSGHWGPKKGRFLFLDVIDDVAPDDFPALQFIYLYIRRLLLVGCKGLGITGDWTLVCELLDWRSYKSRFFCKLQDSQDDTNQIKSSVVSGSILNFSKVRKHKAMLVNALLITIFNHSSQWFSMIGDHNGKWYAANSFLLLGYCWKRRKKHGRQQAKGCHGLSQERGYLKKVILNGKPCFNDSIPKIDAFLGNRETSDTSGGYWNRYNWCRPPFPSLPGLVGELLASPKGTQTSPSWFRTTGWMLKSFKKNEILM